MPKNNEKNISKNDLLTYYWNFFQLHSNQRMQLISFYITIEIVLIGAFFSLTFLSSRFLYAELGCSFMISFISLIFYGLDYRTKSLIHYARICIKKLESSISSDYGKDYQLMNFVEKKSTDPKEHQNGTYSFWINLQFIVIGAFGIVGFATSLYTLLK